VTSLRSAALVVALGVTGCAAGLDEGPPSAAPSPVAHPATPGAPAASHQQGLASFYSDRLAGRRTAAGEPYDPRALTAAHRTLPFGSIVDVVRADGRHVTVRINDRGPHVDGRVIDLSRRAAAEIGLVRDGVGPVTLRVLYVPPSRRRR
jgi:rare lipoprotein A